jgi:hypothetical protein
VLELTELEPAEVAGPKGNHVLTASADAAVRIDGPMS